MNRQNGQEENQGLSQGLNQETSQSDPYSNSLLLWAPLAAHQANLARELCEVLEALAQKRVTLEEKLIRRYFHELAAECGTIIVCVNKLLQNQPQLLDPQLAAKLREIDDEIFLDVRELKKIVEYNLNYLEQYFEHGFYSKIENDCRFLERMQSVGSELQQLCRQVG